MFLKISVGNYKKKKNSTINLFLKLFYRFYTFYNLWFLLFISKPVNRIDAETEMKTEFVNRDNGNYKSYKKIMTNNKIKVMSKFLSF